jgi:hypothetical protein
VFHNNRSCSDNADVTLCRLMQLTTVRHVWRQTLCLLVSPRRVPNTNCTPSRSLKGVEVQLAHCAAQEGRIGNGPG